VPCPCPVLPRALNGRHGPDRRPHRPAHRPGPRPLLAFHDGLPTPLTAAGLTAGIGRHLAHHPIPAAGNPLPEPAISSWVPHPFHVPGEMGGKPQPSTSPSRKRTLNSPPSRAPARRPGRPRIRNSVDPCSSLPPAAGISVDHDLRPRRRRRGHASGASGHAAQRPPGAASGSSASWPARWTRSATCSTSRPPASAVST
jgi:hypothetical protein